MRMILVYTEFIHSCIARRRQPMPTCYKDALCRANIPNRLKPLASN